MLAYRLDSPPQSGLPFTLDLRVVRILKSGGWGADRQCPPQQLQNATAKYVKPDDRAILRLLSSGMWHSPPPLPDDPDIVDLLMKRVVATGRCRWRKLDSPPLTLGSPLPGRLAWQLGGDGRQTIAVEIDDRHAVVLPAASAWYVDPHRQSRDRSPSTSRARWSGSRCRHRRLRSSRRRRSPADFERDFAGFALPRPRADMVEELRVERPVPTLALGRGKRSRNYWDWRANGVEETIDVALLGYAYGGVAVDIGKAPRELRTVEDGKIIVRRRDLGAERAAKKRMSSFGLQPFDTGGTGGTLDLAYGFPEGAQDWPRFVHDALPQLEREGWRIEIEDGFRHRVVDGGGEWVAGVEEVGGWWFSLDLGVEIDGERVALLPVLTSLLARLRDLDAPGGLDALAHNGTVFGTLARHGRHPGIAARPHQGHSCDPGRAVPPEQPVRRRASSTSRPARRSALPHSKTR